MAELLTHTLWLAGSAITTGPHSEALLAKENKSMAKKRLAAAAARAHAASVVFLGFRNMYVVSRTAPDFRSVFP